MSFLSMAAFGGCANIADVGGRAPMPDGWRVSCGRRPEACDVETLAAVNIHITPAVWDELDRGNRRTVVPISNRDHCGTMLDHRHPPVDGKRDCQVYAL